MRTSINSTQGVVTSGDGNGVSIEGREYHEAPFDERWDDLYAYINEGTGPAALTYEAYRDTGFFMKFFRYNQDDVIFMTYQMSHMWDTTTSVYPHMHFVACASGSGNVHFHYAYTWARINGELSGSSGWTSGSLDLPVSASMQYLHKIAPFGAIAPPVGAKESDMLVFKVQRLGASDSSDTYETNKPDGTASANFGIFYFDLHFQKIKAGTTTQYSTG